MSLLEKRNKELLDQIDKLENENMDLRQALYATESRLEELLGEVRTNDDIQQYEHWEKT